MSRDTLSLRLGGSTLDTWIRYSVTTALTEPEGSFELETAATIDVAAGDRIQLWINGTLEFTGIVDSVRRKTAKGSRTVSISGRSLFALLVDSSVTDFGTMPTTLQKLAEKLVRKLPYIGKENFKFQDAAGKVHVDANWEKDKENRKHIQVKPGESVFEVFKRAANTQQLLFWGDADGSFVVGHPRRTGNAEYHIIGNSTGGTNYIEGESEDTIVDRHSLVIVVGDAQDDDGIGHVKKTLENKKFPFYRPLVLAWNDEDGPASKGAKLRLESEDANARRLTYTMRGHALDGRVFRVNRLVRVDDVPNNVFGMFRITKRTFTCDREGSRKTTIMLEPVGGAFL